jgi:UDP-N-acetylglucosamine--dolichyl-phosphate N-acetylglucosaminephosphotransferase
VRDVIGRGMIRFLELLSLAKITRDEKGEWIDCNNLTLLNLVLFKFGPMNEGTLAWYICGLQILGSLLAFSIRYGLVHIVYN